MLPGVMALLFVTSLSMGWGLIAASTFIYLMYKVGSSV